MRLVCLHGTGDAYLTCALARAFEAQHKTSVRITVKTGHRAIPELFDLPHEINDVLIARAETDPAFQQSHENDGTTGTIFVHPTFIRSGARLDQMTVKPEASQADMYRALLRLSPWTPLERPTVRGGRHQNVLIIPEARSWPNLPMAFWNKVVAALEAGGREPIVNKPDWSLRELLEVAAGTDWIIGTQCGVMSIACEAGFRGRKTFVVKELQGPLLFGLTAAMPYAHVSKFAGTNHPDVKHVVVGENWDKAVDQIMRPPCPAVMMPLGPGEFLDRYAVLSVKRFRLPADLRPGTEAEHRMYEKEAGSLEWGNAVEALYVRLVAVHDRTYTLLESAVKDAFNGALSAEDHAAAIRLNKERVELRQQIDAAMGAEYTEVKSYYGT